MNRMTLRLWLVLTLSGCSLWAESNANNYRGAAELDATLDSADGQSLEDVATPFDGGPDVSVADSSPADASLDAIVVDARDASADVLRPDTEVGAPDARPDGSTGCTIPSGLAQENFTLSGFGPIYRLPVQRAFSSNLTETNAQAVVVATDGVQDALVYRAGPNVYQRLFSATSEMQIPTLSPLRNFGTGRGSGGGIELVAQLNDLTANRGLTRSFSANGVAGNTTMGYLLPLGNIVQIATAFANQSVITGVLRSPLAGNQTEFSVSTNGTLGTTNFTAARDSALASAGSAFLFAKTSTTLSLSDGQQVLDINLPSGIMLRPSSLALIAPGQSRDDFTAFADTSSGIQAWDIHTCGATITTCMVRQARRVVASSSIRTLLAAQAISSSSVALVTTLPSLENSQNPGDVKVSFSGCTPTTQMMCEPVLFGPQTQGYPANALVHSVAIDSRIAGGKLRVVVAALVTDLNSNLAATRTSVWVSGFTACVQ